MNKTFTNFKTRIIFKNYIQIIFYLSNIFSKLFISHFPTPNKVSSSLKLFYYLSQYYKILQVCKHANLFFYPKFLSSLTPFILFITAAHKISHAIGNLYNWNYIIYSVH